MCLSQRCFSYRNSTLVTLVTLTAPYSRAFFAIFVQFLSRGDQGAQLSPLFAPLTQRCRVNAQIERQSKLRSETFTRQ